MKECDKRNSHISSKLHLIYTRISSETFTPLHYTCRHFTSSHLNFTQLHFTTFSFGLTPLSYRSICADFVVANEKSTKKCEYSNFWRSVTSLYALLYGFCCSRYA